MRRRMATEAPVYDLTLLLDTALEDERRDTILANVEEAIDRSGEIVGRHDWGVRTTAYEVRKHADAGGERGAARVGRPHAALRGAKARRRGLPPAAVPRHGRPPRRTRAQPE